MKRFLTIPVFVALAHFLVAASVFCLARVPAAITFYLGLFASSEQLGSAFSLLLYPAFWLLSAFHLSGPLKFSFVLWWLCVLASSVFYGLLAAGVCSAARLLLHPRATA